MPPPEGWIALLILLVGMVLYQGWAIRKMRENDKQARWIIQHRQQMLDEARFESECIRKEAQEQHKGEEAS